MGVSAMANCASCKGSGLVFRAVLAFRKNTHRVVYRYADICVRCGGAGTEPSTPVIGT